VKAVRAAAILVLRGEQQIAGRTVAQGPFAGEARLQIRANSALSQRFSAGSARKEQNWCNSLLTVSAGAAQRWALFEARPAIFDSEKGELQRSSPTGGRLPPQIADPPQHLGPGRKKERTPAGGSLGTGQARGVHCWLRCCCSGMRFTIEGGGGGGGGGGAVAPARRNVHLDPPLFPSPMVGSTTPRRDAQRGR